MVYSKVATAGDAGSSVSVTYGGTVHGTLQIVDYRGTNATSPIQQAVSGGSGAATSITSPTVAIGGSGNWVVTIWSTKSAAITTLSTPAGQTSRSADNGSGGGHINTLIVDSGAPVTGNAGGLTSTADQAPGAATTWTIVLTQ